MTNDQVKGFCLNLLQADDEKTVENILKQYGYWDNPTVWREYGDRSGNFSTIGNQQSRPEAALVEKIINSVDASLMGECLSKGIDLTEDNAPQTIPDAVAQFTGYSGNLRDWPQQSRKERSHEITLAATGPKIHP